MHFVVTHAPLTHWLFAPHVPQFWEFPQPSLAAPHVIFCCAHDLELQVCVEHFPLTQFWPDGHTPQLSRFPQPSDV